MLKRCQTLESVIIDGSGVACLQTPVPITSRADEVTYIQMQRKYIVVACVRYATSCDRCLFTSPTTTGCFWLLGKSA